MIVVFLICIACSFFFSSAETSLVSVNRIKIQTLAKENKRAQLVLKIIDNQDKMLSTILIGNNIVNLSASSIATILATEWFGSAYVGVATGIVTILVLIFGEITPKRLASASSEKVAMMYCRIIWFLMTIFTPLVIIVNAMSGVLLRILGVTGDDKSAKLTEEELGIIIDNSLEDGAVTEGEHKIIKNIFDFDNNLAKDIMTPKKNITLLQDTMSLSEILDVYNKEKYTRYPVYHETEDNIIGFINIKDLVGVSNLVLNDIIRPVHKGFEYTKVSELYRSMKKHCDSMTIIFDEYGQLSGLISLEDLIEEIVGDIYDEYDDVGDDIKEIEEGWIIRGSLSLDDVNEHIGSDFVSENYDSIGGYFIDKFGKMPVEKSSVKLEKFTMIVDKIHNNEILSIKLIRRKSDV